VGQLDTEHHRTVGFYVSWFTRCYRNSDAGWFAYRTPDDHAICDQDAFFWNALETIARKLNEMIALAQAKQTSTNG
jgi:hypothetical protein